MSFNRRLAIWPTLPLNVHFRTISNWRPFPLDQKSCRFFSLARHAIWNACRALEFEANDVILVPAYHHGSEIEALLQAGLKIQYYELNAMLEPESANLQSLLTPDVRALFLIHYLGFPQNATVWRQWCDERGLLLFEDGAQAFLSTLNGRPIGSFGHVGVFCLYKTYGIPDGSALISIVPPSLPTSAIETGSWRVFKRHFNWVAQRQGVIGFILIQFGHIVKRWKKIKKSQPNKEFELQDPSSPPSAMTTRLLSKIVDGGTAERRRENYRFLLKHLGELVPEPFASLPEGACPFAFPIEVSDAREFLKRLHHLGVGGLLFWFNPHPSLPVANFPRSKALRERVLALPVHQELTKANLQQIVRAVRKALK